VVVSRDETLAALAHSVVLTNQWADEASAIHLSLEQEECKITKKI
jgi:hypothetical protein